MLQVDTPVIGRRRSDGVSRVSLQVAILKVLSSYPDGRATLKAMNADLAVLNTSGRDWADRIRRLAAWVPDLDIFSQRFVSRNDAGWQITEEGRSFLVLLETSDRLTGRLDRAPEAIAATTLPSAPPPPLLIGAKRQHRKAERGRFSHLRRRSA
jgi:hypothetical protein